MSSSSPPAMKAPYLPTTAALGSVPTRIPDVPLTSVFLVLFVALAATHMTILQLNQRRSHKFLLSGLTFGFCMARITTCTMRLVQERYPRSIPIAIAASVFVSAGVVLLFVINLIFTQRILRALHPGWAWHPAMNAGFVAFYASIVVMLIALITCTVQSFYTLSHNTRRIDRDVQLVGSTYFAFAAFAPLLLLAVGMAVPRTQTLDRFGTGKMRTKIAVVVSAALLLTLGAAFRAGIAYVPRPRAQPAWYHGKGCFYFFNFTIEVLVVLLYAVARADLRFHVPNGASGAGSYSRGMAEKEERERAGEE